MWLGDGDPFKRKADKAQVLQQFTSFGERRIDIGGIGARRARLALHCPLAHMAHKRLLKGFNQLLELFDGQAG
jgi:hypothetical protein